MSDKATCCQCGAAVSYETGFTFTGGLGDSSQDRIYCPRHAPDQGRGYTVSDLQQMKESNEQARQDRQIQLMELMGADVYFHVTGPTFPPDGVETP